MKCLKTVYWLVCFFIKRMLLHFYWLFPVKKNQFYFDSFYGRSFSCSPKYLYDFLIKTGIAQKKNCYWSASVNANGFDCVEKENCCIPYNRKTIKTIMTSQFIIVNTDIPPAIPLRKNQILINTWHGGGAYKKGGLDNPVENTFLNRIFSRFRVKQTSFILASCERFAQVMKTSWRIKDSDGVSFIPCGMPRNDILFSIDFDVKKLRSTLGVAESDFVVLYAPTFRTVDKIQQNVPIHFDLEKIGKAFEHRFGKTIRFLFRSHYYFTGQKNVQNDSVIDVTNYSDMQELLLISDVLVTDYSSSIWDFSFLNRPCFLYCPDYDSYYSERGFYTPIKDWPGILVKNDDEFAKSIESFDEVAFAEKIKKHHGACHSYENGTACCQVAELIKSNMEIEK